MFRRHGGAAGAIPQPSQHMRGARSQKIFDVKTSMSLMRCSECFRSKFSDSPPFLVVCVCTRQQTGGIGSRVRFCVYPPVFDTSTSGTRSDTSSAQPPLPTTGPTYDYRTLQGYQRQQYVRPLGRKGAARRVGISFTCNRCRAGGRPVAARCIAARGRRRLHRTARGSSTKPAPVRAPVGLRHRRKPPRDNRCADAGGISAKENKH